MIKCLGLVVGVVQTARRDDVLNQICHFLLKHENLRKAGQQFSIDGTVYATLEDWDEFDMLFCRFKLWNGEVAYFAC